MEDRRNSFNLESLTKHSIVSSISSKKGKLRDGPHCNLIADVGIDHYKWKKKDQVGYEWLESNSQLLYHTILLLKNKKMASLYVYHPKTHLLQFVLSQTRAYNIWWKEHFLRETSSCDFRERNDDWACHITLKKPGC